MFMLNVKCVCMCIDRHTAYSIASHIQSPFTVTSKTRVESGGMVPFIPFFTHSEPFHGDFKDKSRVGWYGSFHPFLPICRIRRNC